MSLGAMLDVLSWLLLGAGSFVLVGGAVAILRMPTFYTRIHAAGVNETLGPGLILLGLIFQAGDYHQGVGVLELVIKLVMILVFLVITGPIATHALAKAALDNGVIPGVMRERQRRERARRGGSAAGSADPTDDAVPGQSAGNAS